MGEGRGGSDRVTSRGNVATRNDGCCHPKRSIRGVRVVGLLEQIDLTSDTTIMAYRFCEGLYRCISNVSCGWEFALIFRGFPPQLILYQECRGVVEIFPDGFSRSGSHD